MKTGSFYCWLFGHKFIGKSNFREEGDYTVWDVTQSNFCVRCGIDKQEQRPPFQWDKKLKKAAEEAGKAISQEEQESTPISHPSVK